jgi:hypothetical protein
MNGSFINVLWAIAGVLERFAGTGSGTGTGASNPLGWDGKAYRPSTIGPSDVVLAKWWGMITALAGILGSQETALTAEQKWYLDRLLFGGMGSLNDLVLDERILGPEAGPANCEFNRLRIELFDAFQLL